MNLAAWLQYLETLHPCAIDLGLERIREVADRLKIDLVRTNKITIAGTNGKGSTATLLEALLRESGQTVGLYRSPHLLFYNERILINGRIAGDEEICAAFERIESARADVSLTYFEFGTLAAMLIFTEHGLDFLVLEVGLGGRLDAVNLLDTDLALITNIALDHTEWLGDNREQIGLEKAGIMRQGKTLLYGEVDLPISIRQQARKLNAPVYQYGRDFQVELKAGGLHWQGRDGTGAALGLNLACSTQSLPGLFPCNAALALQAFFHFKLKLSARAIEKAWRNVFIPGRFQIIERKTHTLILDVAHNPHAMQLCVENLCRYFPSRKVTLVLAMLQDKDHQQAIKILAPKVEAWYVAGLANRRGSSAKILYNTLESMGQSPLKAFTTIKEAFLAAQSSLAAGEILLVTGSFYTVAAVQELL
jgi:dihydrofolate synthase/folylpolyglutamate synthase